MIDFVIESNDRNVDLYLRLSRDDKQRNASISIENQDRMLTAYAHKYQYTVRNRYIDDGESGYSFDRPSFDELKKEIEKGDVHRLLIKDMSRLGRHNAKVLLFMEEAKEYHCEVIAVDDSYSNFQDNDSTIGIKTWHNELYVKETSKKVRNVIRMKQEHGEWLSNPPFGYCKSHMRSTQLHIDPECGVIVKRIFQLYYDGYGLRDIARILTNDHVLTPSAYRHMRYNAHNNQNHAYYASQWNTTTIRRMLSDETYIGVLWQQKGENRKIRGQYQRHAKTKWIAFHQHHEAIIDETLFNQCQKQLKQPKRRKSKAITAPVLFQDILFCGDCQKPLRPYQTNKDKRINQIRYYCSTYMKHGKHVCSNKQIHESELNAVFTVLLKRCRQLCAKDLNTIKLKPNKLDNKAMEIQTKEYITNITKCTQEIKQLLEDRLQDHLQHTKTYQTVQAAYEVLLNEKIQKKQYYEQKLSKIKEIMKDPPTEKVVCALDILDEMLATQIYTPAMMKMLIQKMIIYDKTVELYCTAHLSEDIQSDICLMDEKQSAYTQAILHEIKKQMQNQRFSLLRVHAALVKQGYTYAYKGIFMKHIKLLENQHIIVRPHKNKQAIYCG